MRPGVDRLGVDKLRLCIDTLGDDNEALGIDKLGLRVKLLRLGVVKLKPRDERPVLRLDRLRLGVERLKLEIDGLGPERLESEVLCSGRAGILGKRTR